LWNPWQELDGVRREVSSLLQQTPRWSNDWADGPAFNVFAGEAGVVLVAELPGFDADSFDISAKNDTVTIRGKRPAETPENVRYHLRERKPLEFEKTFQLPFTVDAAGTEAAYQKGLLTVTLHRPAKAAPQKIDVRTL
jgi:HSP20 family protein